jgi:TonB family protein
MTGGSNNGWREVKSVSKNDGDFHVTMFESHTFLNDPRLRAAGLLGIVLVIGVLTGAFVYDLFQQQVYVAIPEGNELVLSAYIPTDDPSEIPEVEKMKIDNRKGEVEGGGGGGGRKDPLPASEGRQAPMFKDPPLLTPSKEDISVTDPAMKVFRGNQGPKDVIPPPDSRPMGAGVSKIPSDGSGGPLGQGSGDGSGQGPGRGPGYGPGSNGGAGGGDSGLLGGPRGGGGGGEDDPPKMNAGPSKPFRITSQQKPAYTEEARKAQINGTVRLRVTFNSNGTIGAITPVNQLGYGLTEKAIAAARAIRFEPALKNGVPVTTSKVLEFNFNIY